MTDKLKNIIKEQMPFLPKEVQDSISSLDWVEITEKIGKKYLLNEEEIINLQVETMLVLLGLEEGEAYSRNIENEVGTSAEEAEKIADDADEKIFTPIYNAYTENIKKSGKVKNGKPEQNLNFILSGGDYSAFVNPPLLAKEGAGAVQALSSPQARRGGNLKEEPPRPSGTPPQKGGEGNKPRITDIKSKFTI